MKLYSDFAPRRARQVFVDIASLVLIAGWISLGATVYRTVADLAAFGRQMEDAGAEFRRTMSDAGTTLGGIPLIGGGIRVPFDGASGAGRALEEAGRSQQELTQQLATTLGVGIAVLPIVVILLVWLIPRIRFVRRASQVRALVRAGVGTDLLALRALTNQRITTIANVDADVVGAWRRGDAAVIRELAAIELRSSGVRLPA